MIITSIQSINYLLKIFNNFYNIIRRFGLQGEEHQTLEEVGKAVGLTRERVRQIQFEAIRVLRGLMIKNGYIEKE